MDWLVDFHLENGYLIKPLIVGTLVSVVCSVVGCFIILRKLSFLSDAIAHAMLAGVVGGYLLMKILFDREAHVGAMLIGALIAGIVTVALIGFVTRASRIKQDSAIGIMYTGIFALGAFVVSLKFFGEMIQIDIYHFIVGSVVTIGTAELWIAAIVAAIVLSTVILFFRQLQLTSFDPVMAASIGINVALVDYLLTACTSLVVVSGVRIAGVILVVALIITPAASAYLLFDRLSRMIIASAIIGAVCFWVGFAVALLCGTSPGPSIVIVSTLFFMGTLTLAPRYGILADWFRRKNAIPQEIKEDVLGAILRSDQEWVPLNEVIKNVTSRNFKIRRALSLLERQDFVEEHEGQFKLTDEGHREARRLVRAHRIWETYLQHMGTPDEQLHPKAHKLEHINDEDTIEYLDDKLGHPIHDPHGSEIPANLERLQSGSPLKASLLREGHRAVIRGIATSAAATGLQVGDHIEVGPRVDSGDRWTLKRQDGSEVRINHDEADAIDVELL